MQKAQSLTGFTLVELLIAIASIGVVIGMLLPAVQSVRKAAQQASCLNKMKQLALALHNYESRIGRFPPGMQRTYGNGDVVDSDLRGNWGWAAFILPDVELQAVSDAVRFNQQTMAEALDIDRSREVLQQRYSLFLCPGDSAETPNVDRRMDGLRNVSIATSTSNYVGVNGSLGPYRQYSPPWLYPDQGYPVETEEPLARGMFIMDRETRISAIWDGTSNTLMLGERAWQTNCENPDWGITGAALLFGCRGDKGRSKSGMADVVGGGLFGINGNVELYDWCDQVARGFTSQHSGGANFAFADGHVKTIKQTIQMRPDTSTVESTWEKLCAIADGGIISDFE